jgi:hypothetical protein
MSEVLTMYQDKKTRDAFTARAMGVYDTHKSTLEGSHVGEIAAIEPESGDHVVAKTLGKADRAMFERHPDAWVLFVRIGEPEKQIMLKTW